jgi:mono/diheme cytochrome c family protein
MKNNFLLIAFFLFTIACISITCRKIPYQNPQKILNPNEAVKDFKLSKGFVAELVSAEPDIEAPVALAFDAAARMWVVEMRNYMPDLDGLEEKQNIGRIKILEDKDKNGTYETVQIFLDSLAIPRAVCPIYGGVLVVETPNLWFYEIKKDLKAGNRILIDSTYAAGLNPEHAANGLIIGIDNWIYSAKSDRRYRMKEGKWEQERTEWRGQWGIAQDDFGRLIYNDNSTVLRVDQWQPGTLPVAYEVLGGISKTLFSKRITSNRVFPRTTTLGVNRGYNVGVLDEKKRLKEVSSACGPTIYRGDNFPETYRGNAFCPEPIGFLIKRIVLSDSLGFVKGQFADLNAEFLTATDQSFRPVNTYTAPDGTLYVVDMHKGVFQHITYMTPSARQFLVDHKMEQIRNYGRIFRIRWKENALKSSENLESLSSTDLVGFLNNKNGWKRDKAQQMLIERKAKVQVPALELLAQDHENPVAQLHALWTLEGLGKLRFELLGLVFSKTENEQVKRAVLRLFTEFSTSASALDAFATLRDEKSKTLEMQYCATLPAFYGKNTEKAYPLLLNIAQKYASDSLMSTIIAGNLWQKNTQDQVRDLRMSFFRNKIALSSPLMRWLSIEPIPPVRNSDITYFTTDDRQLYKEGANFYKQFCASCHGNNGEGMPEIAPTLVASGWVNAKDVGIPLSIVYDGMIGKMTVANKLYNLPGNMPGMRNNPDFNDGVAAKVLTFIRNSWGNTAGSVSVETAVKHRIATQNRKNPYTATELYPSEPEPHSFNAATQEEGHLKEWDIKNEFVPSGTLLYPPIKNPIFNQWISIFNDSTLAGWHQIGGKARYEVKNGEIQGITVHRTPNSFLTTDQRYSDFVLEMEFKVDTGINSGVQFRSNTYENYKNSTFYGYQVDIDPSPRKWSGGVYDEGRRAWLSPLKDNPDAMNAFQQFEWNHYRIEAKGAHIRTWINGVPAVDMRDSFDLSGYIGLQVHNTYNDSLKANRYTRWRNIRLIDLGSPVWTADRESPETHRITHAYDDFPETTYWEGKALEVDLRAVKDVSELNLVILKGENVLKEVVVKSSEDGIVFTNISLWTLENEVNKLKISFQEQKMRYLRVSSREVFRIGDFKWK